MTALRTDDGKADFLQCANQFFSGDALAARHQATLTCCTAMNVRRGDATLDHGREPQRVDDVRLALVEDDAAAPGAAIDLDRVDLDLNHVLRATGTVHWKRESSANATATTSAKHCYRSRNRGRAHAP